MNTSNVIGNLNIAFEKLFSGVQNDVYKAIDDICDISSDIINTEPLSNILTINNVNYISLISNCFIILYAIYYIVTYFISMYNGSISENIIKVIIKLVVIAIVSNCSIYLCKIVLDINFSLTEILNEVGKLATGENLTFQALKDKIINIDEFVKEDALSLGGIIKGMLSFGSVSVLLNFVIRYVTIIFLILISPIATGFLSSRLTSGIFSKYVKLFIVNILMQNIAKLMLLIPLSCKNTSNFTYKIIVVGSMYLLYKINSFTNEIFSKITSDKFGREL